MKWKQIRIISVLCLVIVLMSFFVLAITSDDIRRNLGMSKIAEWAPSHDSQETGYNYTYRVTIKYYNNASNLTSAYWNYTINFTEQMASLGINVTLNQIANRSVRIYEVNAQGACINESGIANGICTSLDWGVV